MPRALRVGDASLAVSCGLVVLSVATLTATGDLQRAVRRIRQRVQRAALELLDDLDPAPWS